MAGYSLLPPMAVGSPQFAAPAAPSGGILGSRFPRLREIGQRIGQFRQAYRNNPDEYPILNALYENKNALLGFGMADGSWGGALQGLAWGKGQDQEARDRREGELRQQEQEAAVREALALTGMDPAQIDMALRISPEAAGQAAVGQLFPQPGEPYTLGANEIRFDANNRPIAQGPAPAGAGDDQPAAVQTYEYAVSQGYPGTLEDWSRMLAEAGRPQYYEDAYNRIAGETDANARAAILDAETNAIAQLTTFDQMEMLMADPNFYAGFGANQVQALRRLGAVLGITDPAATASGEAFQAAANQAVLAMLGGTLGAQVSNSDRAFISQTMPNLTYSEEGNRLLIEIGRRLAQRKLEVAQMLRDYTADPAHPRLDDGFRRMVAEYVEANPLFSAPESAAAAPGPADAGPPPAGVTQEQWNVMTPAERELFR